MSSAAHTHLRLVGTEDPDSMASWRTARRARQEVIRANRAAADTRLDPADPRWVLAVRAYSQLQGTTMTPERRDRVLRTAASLGVRPFDANVIIAIVQDRARRGTPLAEAEPTLRMLPEPTRRRGTPDVMVRWCAALGCAALLTWLLATWLI